VTFTKFITKVKVVHSAVGGVQVTLASSCDVGDCAVGPFQSDALLVPDHCVFDHVHDQKQCTSYRTWNDTALASCVNRGMLLRSFSMLQPCGIDRFNGVEFVCCPDRTTTAASKQSTALSAA